jgi:hypothetical protein
MVLKKTKDPILEYNHNSQKFGKKNQITSQKIVDGLPVFFHENHNFKIFDKTKIGGWLSKFFIFFQRIKITGSLILKY